MILVLFFVGLTMSVHAQTVTITQVTGINSEGRATEQAKAILEKAYQRIGITVKWFPLPGERALVMTNDG